MSSSEHWRWLPAVLAIVPTGGIAWTEIDAIREQPFWLVVALPVWGAAWLAITVVRSLADRHVPKFVNWCDSHINSNLYKSQKEYLKKIGLRNRDLDVKGLTTQGQFNIELASVYVDLRLTPTPMHQANGNPVAVPKEHGQEAPAELSFVEAVVQNPRIAILGAPGSGKTTLLRHAACIFADKWLEGKAKACLPVLLFLRDVAPLLAADPELDLVDAIAAGCRGHDLDEDWMRRKLQAGACLVMLDGLDEVADPAARQRLVGWVENQVIAYDGNKWVVTARPFGYQSNPIAGFASLGVQPLRRREIERFLDRWYLETERMSSQKLDDGVRMKAEEGAEDLMARIDRSPDLVRLAVNPLLLTLIANVHRWRSSLPGRRVELYNEICDVFLGKRQETKGIADSLTPGQKKLVLQVLAWHMMTKRIRELPEADAAEVIRETLARVSPGVAPPTFFKSVEAGSGLLLEKESGTWGFAHKTFQEYLAAVYAHERKQAETLVGHVADNWWHESIRLYCALGDGSEVIRVCVNADVPTLPALILAVQCLDEAREVDPGVRASLDQLVDQQLDSDDDGRRRLAAECRLALRLRMMARIGEGVFADPTLITNAEYQLFVMAEAEAGHARQPDHWQGKMFPAGTSREPALGVRGVDAVAFCEWLTQRDGGDWLYRLPTAEHFYDMDTDKMDEGTGFWLYRAGGRIVIWSHGVNDDMETLSSSFEEAVGQDLRRISTLSSEERVRLGLTIPDQDMKTLIGLADWADAGGIRVVIQVLRKIFDEWPNRWWWTPIKWTGKTVDRILQIIFSAIEFSVRCSVSAFSRIEGASKEEAEDRVVDAVRAEVEANAEHLRRFIDFALAPIVWFLRPVVTRLFKAEMREIELMDERSDTHMKPWSPDSLTRLIDESGDEDAKMRAVASLVFLVALRLIGMVGISKSNNVPARGSAILSVAKRPDAPPALTSLAKELVERRWGSGDTSQTATDLAWATRISLMLWSRHRLSEFFIGLLRRRGNFLKDLPSEPEFSPLEAWFDAWAIGERASGHTLPFEGIRLVKERRHVD